MQSPLDDAEEKRTSAVPSGGRSKFYIFPKPRPHHPSRSKAVASLKPAFEIQSAMSFPYN
jgi:hypothetical protein